MKQAILLLLHKNVGQANRLINYFQGECNIYIHVDKGGTLTKQDIDSLRSQRGVVTVLSKYHVHWAGFSILRAEMLLLKEALKNCDNTYFHLLSGQDYPIRPLQDFLGYFSHTSDLGYIGCQHLPTPVQDNNTLYRLQHYVLSDYIPTKNPEGKKKVWDIVDWQKKHGLRRRIPDYFDHLYGGSAWFSVSRPVADFVYKYTYKHPAFYRRMRFTYIPEEIYVPTVILNSPYASGVVSNNNCRTILWNHEGIDCSPINIEEDRFRDLLSNPIGFFSRKFDLHSGKHTMELIDQYLLSFSPVEKLPNGGWKNKNNLHVYNYDEWLCNGIISFCKMLGLQSVCDFGCGSGWYVSKMFHSNIKAVGYDANPFTPELSALMLGLKGRNLCGICDLTEDLCNKEPFDLVLSLGVGAYLSPKAESTFINNLKRNAGKYIILTWRGSNRAWISNDLTAELIISKFTEKKDFVYNRMATIWLRERCRLDIYKNEILVFQKV